MSNLKNKKILVINDAGNSYAKPFLHLGLEVTNDVSSLTDPDSVALVVFTGGSDVSPYLYKRSEHPRTMASARRDTKEVSAFALAYGNGIPMAGICRGAQFLCVMAGGSLVQDISNHAGPDHTIEARWPAPEGETIKQVSVTSSHHQMQYPFDIPKNEYDILAVGTECRSTHYAMDADTNFPENEAGNLLRSEPDVVFYSKINALGAQYHPEWMDESSEGFLYFQALVNHYLLPRMESRYDDRDRKKTSSSTS